MTMIIKDLNNNSQHVFVLCVYQQTDTSIRSFHALAHLIIQITV